MSRALVSLGLLACFALQGTASVAEEIHPVPAYPLALNWEMEELIRDLRRRIIPPEGTARRDVEAVFGEGMAGRDDMEEYLLLPAVQSARASRQCPDYVEVFPARPPTRRA